MRGMATCAALAIAMTASALEAQTPSKLRYYYPLPEATPPQVVDADVIVYGGTCAGVTAAVQASRMGKKAVLVEFGTHLGGLTSGGLSATDAGAAAGGIAREFYAVVGQKGFAPAKAEAQFRRMLDDAKVLLYQEHRLTEVTKDGPHLTTITCENGDRFRGKMFIDCTYEGDMMAAAGVSYDVGREGNAVYLETLDGAWAVHGGHGFARAVDPYLTPGDPKSGLLPEISADDPGKPGAGDRRVQAYNFRMYLEKGGRPFPQPDRYDPGRYALLLRYIAAGGGPGVYPHPGDNNNQGAFSTDHIGANYDWPDGTARGDNAAKKDAAYFKSLYALREKIFQDHVTYQLGLCYFLANDPQVPAATRAKIQPWGLSTKDFDETGGWSHQLYVREGRRMIGAYVMTEHNCRHLEWAEDSIGLAEYNMDSHHCQRVVRNGVVVNEGDVQVRVPGSYPVSYRAITPKASECTNLLVPVCLSSSHIAYGSIRMEPVFMVLGQSAATAACLALDGTGKVQEVPYAALRPRLLADRQKLDAMRKPK